MSDPQWIAFDQKVYDRQPLPPERRYVLVRTWPTDLHNVRDRDCTRPAIAVGYMKFGAGCADSPYFVIPSVGGDVVAWCDCLPESMQRQRGPWADEPVEGMARMVEGVERG
jgi:hypothetical protein